MLKNEKKLNNLLSKPQKNSSLAFQFILFEMIKAQSVIESIEQFLNSYQTKNVKNVDQKEIFEILKAITQLPGSQTGLNKYFTWNLNNGILQKIKSYSLEISTFSSSNNPLKKYSEIAICASLEILNKADVSDDNLLLAIKKLLSSYQKLVGAMKKLFLKFQKDENVLFFLLRYQKELEEIFGEGFACKTLKTLFSDGLNEAEKYIKNKFQKRGFDHLLPIINEKIKELC